jgi:hypothetical protein
LSQHTDDGLDGECRRQVAQDAGSDSGLEIPFEVADEESMDLAQQLVELGAVAEENIDSVV